MQRKTVSLLDEVELAILVFLAIMLVIRLGYSLYEVHILSEERTWVAQLDKVERWNDVVFLTSGEETRAFRLIAMEGYPIPNVDITPGSTYKMVYLPPRPGWRNFNHLIELSVIP